jgi:hypothetical protein
MCWVDDAYCVEVKLFRYNNDVLYFCCNPHVFILQQLYCICQHQICHATLGCKKIVHAIQYVYRHKSTSILAQSVEINIQILTIFD